mmetsp:Transcript_116776/g.250969  ORF Transcript_116776/g.250969 Transcript_116776/m.250969 type:complete len:89 (+) Transcript_116776:374-640(+)
MEKQHILVIDPMIGTGGSCCMALSKLQERGVDISKVFFINIVSCPEGISRLNKEFPEVKVYTASMDSKMNDQKYITPGLGDFGDRYYF